MGPKKSKNGKSMMEWKISSNLEGDNPPSRKPAVCPGYVPHIRKLSSKITLNLHTY